MNDRDTPPKLRWRTAQAATAFVLLMAMAMAMLPVLARAAGGSDSYPDRPIRVFVGFSAGGGTDVLARILAHKMSESLGTPVLVENKPGANGNIAADIVARAPADGYTLLFNTSSIVLGPLMNTGFGSVSFRDLAPVGLAANQPLVLVASRNSGITSFSAFESAVKTRPGTLNFGSAGNGNITHLSMLLLQQITGGRCTHVPYNGDAGVLTDLVGGRIDLYMGTAAGVAPLIRDHRIQALAVASLARLPTLPEVPTLRETTGKALVVGSWSGMMAPARTPREIVFKLDAALRSALADKDVQADFAARGVEVKGSTPAEYSAFLEAESARWTQLVKDAGMALP